MEEMFCRDGHQFDSSECKEIWQGRWVCPFCHPKGFGVMNKTVPLTHDAFFPPPWNINEFPEKTEGWIEFQKAMRKDPSYYKV